MQGEKRYEAEPGFLLKRPTSNLGNVLPISCDKTTFRVKLGKNRLKSLLKMNIGQIYAFEE